MDNERVERAFWTLVSSVALVGVWWLGSILFPTSIPSPQATVEALVTVVSEPGPLGNPWTYHVRTTLTMILVSLTLAMIIGTVIGVIMGIRTEAEEALTTTVYIWLALPSLVLVFLAGIWMGGTVLSGYFAITVVTTPFVILNMWSGASNLDRNVSEMAEFFGASPFEKFWNVIIPQLVPFVFASIRSAFSIGWKIALLVEAFVLDHGMGFMFKWQFNQYDLATMLAWVVIFVGVLILVEYGLIIPARNRATRWMPEVDVSGATAGVE